MPMWTSIIFWLILGTDDTYPVHCTFSGVLELFGVTTAVLSQLWLTKICVQRRAQPNPPNILRVGISKTYCIHCMFRCKHCYCRLPCPNSQLANQNAYPDILQHQVIGLICSLGQIWVLYMYLFSTLWQNVRFVWSHHGYVGLTKL